MTRGNIVLPIYFLITTILLFSCTDAGLQPMPEEVTTYDNKLAVNGQYCTSPAREVTFPVKLLIVMDQSASLQCTDPANNRLTALNIAGAELSSQPNVEFGVVGFASWSTITEFTPSWNDASNVLAPEDGQGGPATDYQGALSTTLRILEQDMVDSGPAEAARSRYVVLFLSDGIPEPRCNAGCEDSDEPPDSLYGVCNTSEEIDDDEYVDMYSECPEYNQTPQILQKVDEIVALADFYGVGSLEFHTIFLFAPEEAVTAACVDMTRFGYVREEAEPLLRSMAERGRGTFRDVNLSEEIDFLEFNYQSLLSAYELKKFFAINMNALPGLEGPVPDSDRDGLNDIFEFENDMQRVLSDTDNDAFSDILEFRYLNQGFDPSVSTVPLIGCQSDVDFDGDGLKECEETFLGTNDLMPDTDGDRLPDNIEVRFGTDPLHIDALVDHDFDNTESEREIALGTNPKVLDDENVLIDRVLYSVSIGEEGRQETQCYDFSVQEISLVETLEIPETVSRWEGTTENIIPTDGPTPRGTNRILVFAQEEPANRGGNVGIFRIACVEVQYLGETYKNPPSGIIPDIPNERFVEMSDFDPDIHCIKPGDDPSVIAAEETP